MPLTAEAGRGGKMSMIAANVFRTSQVTWCYMKGKYVYDVYDNTQTYNHNRHKHFINHIDRRHNCS